MSLWRDAITNMALPQTTPYDALIRSTAIDFGLPFDLLRAQVIQESNGDPFAFRYEPAYFHRYIRFNDQAKAKDYGPIAACSCGLMQILVETAYEIGFIAPPWDLFIPSVNLEWGCRYLTSLLRQYDEDYSKALAAYNGGPGAVQDGPPYRTQSYVNAVFLRAGRTLHA